MEFPSIPDDGDTLQGIHFDSIDVEFPALNADALSGWLIAVAKTYGKSIRALSYVLCSDEYLLKMNVERLDHDTYTDIITFDLSDDCGNEIEGECYISIDRVTENAALFNDSVSHELNRVFVHGLLHLCGLGDKTEEEAKMMREAENGALELLQV